MPIADMTGAAANRISVARDLGRYNQGQKDQLLGGISAVGDLGAAAIEAQHRTKMEQLLQEQGFDPATAKNLIAAGPHAAASALLQKKREAQQEAQRRATAEALGLAGGVNPATQHAGMGGGSGGAASQGRAPAFDNAGQPIAGASAPSGGGMDWGSVDPSAMEFLARQRADTTKTEGERKWYFQKQASDTAAEKEVRGTPTYGESQAVAERKAFQEALKGASAPAQQPFNLIGGPLPGATGMTVPVQPGGADIARGMAQRGFSYNPPSELTPPKEPTLDPSVIERNRADAEEARARAEALRTPKPVKPEPYKPMTREEQIQFEADRAAATRAEPRDPNANVDAVERLKRRMSVDDQTEFERLFNGAKQGPFGTAPTAESVNAFKEFVGAMMAKYPEAAPRQIGGGGGRAPAATGAVDSALKSEFDAFPPERQKALLEQMGPEERAKVGR